MLLLKDLLIVAALNVLTVTIVLEICKNILFALQINANLVNMNKLHVRVMQIKYVHHVLQAQLFLILVGLQHAPRALVHVLLAVMKLCAQEHQTECVLLAH